MTRICRTKKGRFKHCTRKRRRSGSRKRSRRRRSKSRRSKSRSKSKSRWQRHLMKIYRQNKKAGLTAAMKKAKKSYRKQQGYGHGDYDMMQSSFRAQMEKSDPFKAYY